MTEPPDAEPADALGLLRAARNQMFRDLAAEKATVEFHTNRRDALAAELDGLNAMIARLSGEPAGADTPTSGRATVTMSATGTLTVGSGKQPDSTRQAVLALLQGQDRVFEISEILDGVRRLGIDTQDASTRSILAKMSNDDGPVERVRRGQYRARTWDEVAFGATVSAAGRPTPAEFMAMRSQPGDEDFDPDDGRLFTDEDVRGHSVHVKDQQGEESASA